MEICTVHSYDSMLVGVVLDGYGFWRWVSSCGYAVFCAVFRGVGLVEIVLKRFGFVSRIIAVLSTLFSSISTLSFASSGGFEGFSYVSELGGVDLLNEASQILHLCNACLKHCLFNG